MSAAGSQAVHSQGFLVCDCSSMFWQAQTAASYGCLTVGSLIWWRFPILCARRDALPLTDPALLNDPELHQHLLQLTLQLMVRPTGLLCPLVEPQHTHGKHGSSGMQHMHCCCHASLSSQPPAPEQLRPCRCFCLWLHAFHQHMSTHIDATGADIYCLYVHLPAAADTVLQQHVTSLQHILALPGNEALVAALHSRNTAAIQAAVAANQLVLAGSRSLAAEKIADAAGSTARAVLRVLKLCLPNLYVPPARWGPTLASGAYGTIRSAMVSTSLAAASAVIAVDALPHLGMQQEPAGCIQPHHCASMVGAPSQP